MIEENVQSMDLEKLFKFDAVGTNCNREDIIELFPARIESEAPNATVLRKPLIC